MEFILTIILLIPIIAAGYCFINKIGKFLDEDVDSLNDSNRTKLIYVGFDMPSLVEDFFNKIDKVDKHHHAIEVIVYYGMHDEIIKMLQEGALDYAVMSTSEKKVNIENINSKEFSLKPEKLRTNLSNVNIDVVNCEYKNAVALWISNGMSKEKQFFSNLILQL